MHVTGFSWSVSDSIINWSVSVSIFVFRFWFTVISIFRYVYDRFSDFKSQVIVTLAYLSLKYAPWSEGGCLSPAKLRSTDSVSPRAVLSRVRPRYRPLL
jgi:hypothetical protein